MDIKLSKRSTKELKKAYDAWVKHPQVAVTMWQPAATQLCHHKLLKFAFTDAGLRSRFKITSDGIKWLGKNGHLDPTRSTAFAAGDYVIVNEGGWKGRRGIITDVSGYSTEVFQVKTQSGNSFWVREDYLDYDLEPERWAD